jgi:hypothetical protein
MFKSISFRGLSGWRCKDYRMIYKFWRRRIVKQDELDGDPKFTTIIGFGGKLSSYWMEKKDNLENEEENVGITETPYRNLMLDIWVLRIEERFVGHTSFLPQEVGRCEVWTCGLQRMHSYKRQNPWKEM